MTTQHRTKTVLSLAAAMKKTLLSLAILSASALSANAATFYTISDFNHNMDNNNPGGLPELAAGPGVGFDVTAPHDSVGGANNWYTSANTGNYMIGHAGPEHIWFDFGSDVLLTEISVWGYSNGNANGIRQFDVQFATNAQGGTATLGDEIYGSSTAQFTALQDPTPRQSFSFAPIDARYVRVNAITNYAGQGSPGGDRLGIGEIAFEGGSAPNADFIQPSTISASHTTSNTPEVLINAATANGGIYYPAPNANSGGNGTSWYSSMAGTTPVTLDFDFSSATSLDELYLWDYYRHSPTDWTLKLYSGADGAGTELLSHDFTIVPGPEPLATKHVIDFADVAGVLSGSLVTRNNSTGGGVGLAEIGFTMTPIPEPSTFLLAALGLLALLGFTRRRRK